MLVCVRTRISRSYSLSIFAVLFIFQAQVQNQQQSQEIQHLREQLLLAQSELKTFLCEARKTASQQVTYMITLEVAIDFEVNNDTVN